MQGSERKAGPFWDAVNGRAPLPRAAATLGMETISPDGDSGTIDLTFIGSDDFMTPMGDILGGFLAAMFYDTVGPCLLARLDPSQFIETLNLNTTFLRPARPGRISAKGRVVHEDGDLEVLEASLHNDAGDQLAIAAATIRIVTIAERKAHVTA